MQPNLPGYLQTTHDLRDPRLARQQQMQQQKQYVVQAGGQFVPVQPSGAMPQQVGTVPAFSQAGVMAAGIQQQYFAANGRMAAPGQQVQPCVVQSAWVAAAQPAGASQCCTQQTGVTTSGQLHLRPSAAQGALHSGLVTATLQSPAGTTLHQQAGMPQLQPMQQQALTMQQPQQHHQQPQADPIRTAQQQQQQLQLLPPEKQGAGQQATGGSSGASGPRPMKRQAYQGLQSSVPKRFHYATNRYTSGTGSDAAVSSTPTTAGDAAAIDTYVVEGGSSGANTLGAAHAPGGDTARPGGMPATQGMRLAPQGCPGEVQMLADAQALMCTIMLYMVKHKQFSSAAQSSGQQQVVQGYDLCRFKQDFTDKYKYELVHKAVGHAKVKELIVWLMMDAVEMRMTGAGSHMVLYPRPDVDYSKFRYLDCDRVLLYFESHTDAQVVGKLPSIKQQIKQYQFKVADAVAEAEANGIPLDGKKAAAAAEAALVNGATVLGIGPVRAEAGLDLPLSIEQLNQQQLLHPKQQLVNCLRRQLLELRVMARRTAVAEAWTNSYMRLDEQVDSILNPEPGGTPAGHFKQLKQAVQADGSDAVAGKDEDSSLLKGLVEEAGNGAAAGEQPAGAAASAAVEQAEDQSLLQGLDEDQDAISVRGSHGNDGAATGAGAQQQQQQQAICSAPPAHASFSAAPGVRAKAAGPLGGGDNKYQAGLAIRAKELLQQWPLQLCDVLAVFAAEHPKAHQQLLQMMDSAGTSFAQVVQELITEAQPSLCATLTDPAATTAAADDDKQQDQQQDKLWATEPNAADVSCVIQMYEHVAALLLETMPKGQPRASSIRDVPLCDPPSVNSRPGLASKLLCNWPALQLQHIQELGVASLEQLLEQQTLFGRLLAIRRVETGDARVMVRSVVNPRADLLLLLERRMVQLVGAGLRTAITCCTLPPLAGYRLDRLKQDFALEYGYALQQQQMCGSQSFRALMEGFPDYCYYKTHQRNTLIMHPSPVMHLRLLLRLLLAPVKAVVQQQQQVESSGAAEMEGVDAGMAGDDTANASSGSRSILAIVTASRSNPVMGGAAGFSAPTSRYPGCPSASVAPALELLAAAVEAALSPHHSMAHSGPAGTKVYPVIAVQQAFEAVYGYSMPLYRLGIENFKQLLMELDGECSLTPEHILTGEPPPPVPEVWYVTPPKAIATAPGEKPKVKADSAFRELYLKRLAASKAMPLMDWEPTPLGAAGAAASAVGSGGGYTGSTIPALGGGVGSHSSSSSRGPAGGRHGSGEYAAAHRQQWSAGKLQGGASRARIMAAVSDLLRRKLATVTNAYDANGQRTSVALEAGYPLNNLHSDLRQATGLTLDVDALGFKNLVQLVGALPDVATVVFSPDRQHRVFPPKPGRQQQQLVGLV